MATFREKLGTPAKKNNHSRAVTAKAAIRANVLAAIGADKAHVLDCFAGDGEMYRRVWHGAKSYVGCDTTWYRDARRVFVADNRRVLRAIDLSGFNIFDLDAYGSPWEQCVIIGTRRPLGPGESVGFVVTEGSGLKLRFGSFPTALRLLAKMRPSAVGGGASQDELLDRALGGLARMLGADTVDARWQANGKSGSAMRYVGLVLTKK